MSSTVAQQVYESYSQEFPVDPKKIAERLGIIVNERTWYFDDDTSELSGCAYIENGTRYIEVETMHAPVRQRFTIAHELGHHVLGHTQNGQQFRDTPSNFKMNSSFLEVEANNFAAELLMPTQAVRMAVFDRGMRDISDLAKLFNVSEIAMSIRLKNLGMINEYR